MKSREVRSGSGDQSREFGQDVTGIERSNPHRCGTPSHQARRCVTGRVITMCNRVG